MSADHEEDSHLQGTHTSEGGSPVEPLEGDKGAEAQKRPQGCDKSVGPRCQAVGGRPCRPSSLEQDPEELGRDPFSAKK